MTAKTLVAKERADGQARLRATETTYQRQLHIEHVKAAEKFNSAVLKRNRTIDQQQTQIQQLYAVNLDMRGELAEAKSETAEVRLEVARLLHIQRTDAQDLMRLAGRLLQLTDHLGIPLDPPTADTYRRRAWSTTIPANMR